MVKKRKRPELDTADNEESQQPAAPLSNGTHSGEAPPVEALPAPEAQLGSTTDDLVSLHRARFVPWQPTAVVASATSSDGSLVAVAHESGAIEVWETSSWTCRQVFAQYCILSMSLSFPNSVMLGNCPSKEAGFCCFAGFLQERECMPRSNAICILNAHHGRPSHGANSMLYGWSAASLGVPFDGVQVIPGKEDACISCLAWVRDPLDGTEALISGGLDGILTEWDLVTKVPRHLGDSFGGAIWDIAVQPSSHLEQGAPPCPTTTVSLAIPFIAR